MMMMMMMMMMKMKKKNNKKKKKKKKKKKMMMMMMMFFVEVFIALLGISSEIRRSPADMVHIPIFTEFLYVLYTPSGGLFGISSI